MPNTNIGVVPWRNETGIFSYPLVSNVLDVNGVVVDAYWVLFDAFVPTLKTISVGADAVVFTVTTDYGDIAATLDWPTADTKLDFVEPTTGKLLGRIFFGDGLSSFYAANLGTTVQVSTKFVASTVHSIPYDSGVFSINGARGDVTLNSDAHLSFTQDSQGIIFHAIGVPECDPNINPLLTLNGINANSVNLLTNDVLNWTPTGNGIKLELATGSLFNTNIQP